MRKDSLDPSVRRPVGLRPMTCDDVAEGVPLLAQLGYEMSLEELAQRVGAVLATPHHLLLVAEIGGRVVGVVHVFVRPAIENPCEAVVQSLVVDQGFRRRGVGRSLMAAAENWGSERGCRSVVLESNVSHTPAHAFYAALDYDMAATAYILRKPFPPR